MYVRTNGNYSIILFSKRIQMNAAQQPSYSVGYLVHLSFLCHGRVQCMALATARRFGRATQISTHHYSFL